MLIDLQFLNLKVVTLGVINITGIKIARIKDEIQWLTLVFDFKSQAHSHLLGINPCMNHQKMYDFNNC